jgi:hypothetical protein
MFAVFGVFGVLGFCLPFGLPLCGCESGEYGNCGSFGRCNRFCGTAIAAVLAGAIGFAVKQLRHLRQVQSVLRCGNCGIYGRCNRFCGFFFWGFGIFVAFRLALCSCGSVNCGMFSRENESSGCSIHCGKSVKGDRQINSSGLHHSRYINRFQDTWQKTVNCCK